MSDIIDLLSIIFPLLSISFVVIITSINFYFKIRRKFPATVNCWFCNVNTRVPYDDKNAWTCPTCEQYNGFTDDGDYNCDIPAQRNSKLNIRNNLPATNRQHINNASIISSAPNNNGFCTPCNRNQEIKVQQLATFTPEYDDNYDEEIVEFTKKLEQAYRLCYRCDRILNRTLNKVKQNILGSKLSQIGAAGASNIFNMNILRGHSVNKVSAKRRVFTRLCFYLLIVVAVLNLIRIGREIAIGKSQLDSVFPTKITNVILIAISYISAIQHIIGMAIESIMRTQPIVNCIDFIIDMLSIGYRTIITGLISMTIGGEDSVANITAATLKILQTDTSFMLDFAGMLLSIIVLLLNGLKHNGPVIVWLLWSFKMAMPSMENRKLMNHNDAVNEMLFSLINVTISTAIFIASLLNTRCINSSKIISNDLNQSYHKIYTNEMMSDVSDESDDEFVEDIMSTSYSSQRDSNCHRQSSSSNNSVSASKQSLHNTSLNTTKSFSPSMLHGPMLSQLNSSFDTSQYSVMNSKQQQRNAFGGSQSSMLFDDCRSTISGYSRSNALRSQDSLYKPKQKQQQTINDKRFSSLDNVIGNDFQFGINGLNISGNNDMTMLRSTTQPRYTPQQFSSPPQSQLRQRKQVVSPSRFNSMNSTILPAQQPLTQASWVAGGYWSGTSPQKKFPPPAAVSPPTIDLLPILSRTSSQSSGFESRASSVVNGGNGSGGDSEGSICGDAAEQASVFSDTIRSQCSNNFSGSQFNSCSRSLFEQPKQLFPTQCNNEICPSMEIGFNQTIMPTNSRPTVYHQFGTQRAGMPSPSPISFVTTPASHTNIDRSKSAFTFNKLTNNLPVIEQGSLLRDWKQRSMIDVSQQ